MLVTVRDTKTGVAQGGNPALVDYYTPVIANAQDYYPGGMLMPGRTYSSGSQYRYGFNGKENDNDVKDEGNQQDYGMRIYDNRLGRFLSVDPIAKDYPELTPYQFASNKPINSIDLDGLESKEVYMWTDVANRTTKLEVPVSNPYGLGKGILYHQYKSSEVAWRQLSKNSVEVIQKTTDVHFYVPPLKKYLGKSS